MAGKESDEDWKIYWKVNILFHNATDTNVFNCIWCKEKVESSAKLRSDFSLCATKCSANHVPLHATTESIGVCSVCDVNLLQTITERGQKCFQEGCQRFMVIDRDAVKARLGDTALFKKYLQLVDRYEAAICDVCCVDIPLKEFQKTTASQNCQHDPSMCLDCLRQYVEGECQGPSWREIQCPELNCKEVLSGRDVYKFTAKEVFQKYEEDMTKYNLSKHPNFRWCSHNCGNGQIFHMNQSLPKIRRHWKCSKCSKYTCFDCKDQDHPGESCEQHRQFKRHKDEVEAHVRKVSKRCPKRGCQRPIRKERGCAHMTCSRATGGCGTTFCWKCKVIFEDEYRHIAGCVMVGGTYEASETVVHPGHGDVRYGDGWDHDPDYLAGDSDTERYM